MSLLQIKGNEFYLDDQPFMILSGAIHYFRVVPEYWKDRLLKLKACGFNTVETYVAWNLHEPKEGEFCFEGICDIVKFVETAAEVGLKVIVRPGPYICAEWEFGGFPGWLIKDRNMQLRCNYAPYLEKVDNFFDQLIERLVPLLCTKGGPIIGIQVENEYGSYGNDKEYLTHLEQGLIRRGVDCLLFTSDGPSDTMLTGGTLPHVFKTANFGSRPKEAFEVLRKHQPEGPMMCMEYWNGWFDHWRDEHHTRDAEDVANVFDEMLSMGASVNFYMFHGGTNFGFLNGANRDQQIGCTVTSYDYDSPISECGDLTEKYHAVKAVVEKHFGPIAPVEIPAIPKKAYGKVELTEQADLFGHLAELAPCIKSGNVLPMEALDQNYGFTLYRNYVSATIPQSKLRIKDVCDRALVFANGVYQGLVERDREGEDILLEVKEGEVLQLDILVENMGRVNYGPSLKDSKGITEWVRLGYQSLFGWEMYPITLEDLSQVTYNERKTLEGPSLYKGTLEIEELADTFIKLDGFTKGVVLVNGFNIGRYWVEGPQKTYYIPAPLLRQGENTIEVFELHKAEAPVVELVGEPIL